MFCIAMALLFSFSALGEIPMMRELRSWFARTGIFVCSVFSSLVLILGYLSEVMHGTAGGGRSKN